MGADEFILGPCRTGNVGAAAGGPPVALLTVNLSAGSPGGVVSIGIGEPITIAVDQPPGTAAPAPFAIFGFIGAPLPADAFIWPQGIGQGCFTPFDLDPANQALFRLANSFAPMQQNVLAATPAPWSHTVASGLPVPFQLTLPAIIQEDPSTLRLTNAVVLNVE